MGWIFTMPRKNKNKTNGGKKKVAIQVVSGKGAYGIDTMKNLGGKIKQMAKAALKNERVQNGIMNGAGAMAERLMPGSGQSAKTVAKLLLNRINGSGDYEAGGDPTVNSLFKMNKDGQMVGGNALTIPKFDSCSNGVHVAHREYVMDFVAPENPDQFNLLNLVINPGVATVFPWLSNIAVDFQQYRFLGLVVEFISTTSPYNTSPAMGFVAVSAQYNVLQEPFGSMIELENSSESIFCRPDRSIMYGVECKKQSYNMYYIRNPASVVIDPATYDFASIYIATQGLPATFTPGSVLGQIWISYHLELIEPIYTLPYGGSFLATATATTQTGATINDFLSPFLPGSTAYVNYNGRFTPKSLDGTSQPILSTSIASVTTTTPWGNMTDPNNTVLTFRPYNLAAGQGMLCTLTVQFPQDTNIFTLPGNASTKYCAMTPTVSVTGLIDCTLQPWDDSGFISNSVYDSMIGTQLIPSAGSTTVMSFIALPNPNGTYSVSFYMAITGAYPSLSISAFTNNSTSAGSAIYIPLGYNDSYAQYTTSFSAVAIKYTDGGGLPKFVPYSVPTTGTPAMTSRRSLGSMSFHDQHLQDCRKLNDERRMLTELISKHGLSISKEGIMQVAQKGSVKEEIPDDDYVLPVTYTRSSSESRSSR